MTLKFHTVRIGLQFMLRTHTGLLVLRKAIAANPNSFQAKLSAIELYSSIGAAAAALPLWESLRVRFIQADTLSFMLLPELAAGGFISQVSGVSLSRPFSHSSLILPTLTLRIRTSLSGKRAVPRHNCVPQKASARHGEERVACAE